MMILCGCIIRITFITNQSSKAVAQVIETTLITLQNWTENDGLNYFIFDEAEKTRNDAITDHLQKFLDYMLKILYVGDEKERESGHINTRWVGRNVVDSLRSDDIDRYMLLNRLKESRNVGVYFVHEWMSRWVDE